MAHTQKPDFFFRRNGRVHLNRRGRQFSRLLAAEVCASLDTPFSEVVWKILATHSIRQFPLHFLSRASPCAIIFQLESTPMEIVGSAAPIRSWRQREIACPRHRIRKLQRCFFSMARKFHYSINGRNYVCAKCFSSWRHRLDGSLCFRRYGEWHHCLRKCASG